MCCIVQICQQQGAGALLPVPLPDLRALLKVMCRAIPAGEDIALVQQLDLHVVRDGVIAAANSCYMGCIGPTNILSFPGGDGMPGILVLSVDTLLRESLLYGQNAAEHCLRLLAHGMGHLLGYDHSPEMYAVCAVMEDAALRAWYAESSM